MLKSEVTMVKVMCGSKKEAVDIARALLEEKLVACANILGPADSVFWWKGRVETDTEFMLLLKTQKKHIEVIASKVLQLHSYELPEVSALPVTGGLEDFLDWVVAET